MKIHTVGGYSEVGKNMTCLELKDDAFVFDEGFFLPPLVEMHETERNEFTYTEKKLTEKGIIPNTKPIDSIRHKVRAQMIGHAHLDHVGAVPFISDKFNAPVCGTPFTMQVLDSLLKDQDLYLRNKTKTVHPNSEITIKGKNKVYRVEFLNMTHSTPQTSLIVVHTEKGAVVYANDFKLDNTPVLGLKPNYERMKQIAKEGVYALVLDSLYAPSDKKTPSEKIARSLNEEVLMTINNENSAVFVTTFSSHIARLKSIVEFSKKMGREIVFLGRSLNKYSTAAIDANIAPFLRDIRISKYRRQVEKTLHMVEKNRKKYLVVCTGHQGEAGSILERISRNQLPFKFQQKDNIVFSSSVIPTPTNIESFGKMESRLKKKKLRIFRDVHVSGHGGREDIRDLIELLNPQHIIPSHGGWDKTKPMLELGREMGFSKNQMHLMNDGKSLKI
jgi:ribonuclease J